MYMYVAVGINDNTKLHLRNAPKNICLDSPCSVFLRVSLSTCGRENPSNDAAESDKKLPERHVLLSDFNHQ